MPVSPVLLVSPTLDLACGNKSTCQRIKNFFPDDLCSLKSVTELKNVTGIQKTCPRYKLNRYCSKNNVKVVIFLHAFKSGSLAVCNCSKQCWKIYLKYAVIFGGTDLNEDIKGKTSFSVIQHVISGAYLCIAFTKDMKTTALNMVKDANVLVQPQSVGKLKCETFKKETSSGILFKSLKDTFIDKTFPKIFLLIAGIRPVKDPLFVIEPFRKLINQLPEYNLKLLIMGPIIDEQYAYVLFEKINSSGITTKNGFHKEEKHTDSVDNILKNLLQWIQDDEKSAAIKYFPPIAHLDLMYLLHSGLVYSLINSSLSEGMCVSILEGMACSIPIMARNNSSNAEIIKDNVNGLLFSDHEQFNDKAVQLICDENLRDCLVLKAKEDIQSKYCEEKEKEFYLKQFSSF